MSENTRTIVRNTSWYGIENVVSAIAALITSIAIARTLGPAKMGYMVYVMWIASLTASLGSLGIPATTAKYMAEFIGKGDRGTARFIYIRTLLLQMGLSTVATAGILVWVLLRAEPAYSLAATLVVLSIWPAMVNSISAQANVATENLAANLPGSAASTLVYLVAILATVVCHWGVVGVGAAFLGMRTVDFLVRFIPTMRRVLSWGKDHTQLEELRRRMIRFAVQSVASMIVGLIVWSRSEVVLLKYLCSDIRQIAFYSVAFSMADRLLIASSVFGWASATTIYAQHGRDKSKNSLVTASAFRYLALVAIPLHAIAAALAAPALLVFYGSKYLGASMVVTLAPLLCMPKAFMTPVQGLMQSAERQGIVIFATVFAGIVDWSVAAYLIPAHGAVGACIGSGAAQVTAIIILWGMAIRKFNVKLPWGQFVKTVFIAVIAALTAYMIASKLPPFWGVALGGSAALIVLLVLFYLMRVLEPQDYGRFKVVADLLPKSIARAVNALLSLLVQPQAAGEAAQEQLAVKQ
jgi:O-antigen/teichoic acid export membrane protein